MTKVYPVEAVYTAAPNTSIIGQTRFIHPDGSVWLDVGCKRRADTLGIYRPTEKPGEYAAGGTGRLTDILYLCGCQENNVADCAATCNKPHAEQFRKLHEPGQQYTALAPLSSEAKRDTGKPRFDLLEDGCPDALLDVVKVMTWAVEVKAYRAHSWKEVPEARRRYRAAMSRHRNALARGELLDEESGLPHEAHIACNAIFLAQLLYVQPE